MKLLQQQYRSDGVGVKLLILVTLQYATVEMKCSSHCVEQDLYSINILLKCLHNQWLNILSLMQKRYRVIIVAFVDVGLQLIRFSV